MSWADVVRKHCRRNNVTCTGNNTECFVPNASREPHLHCGKGFIAFTDVGHSHRHIAQGGKFYASTAREVLDVVNVAEITSVLQMLVDDYK